MSATGSATAPNGGSILDERTKVSDLPAEAPAATPAEGTSAELGLVMQRQLQSEWCWAALSTSVALFYDAGSPWTQCTVANAGLDQTTCCQDGGTAACNQPNYLEKALALVGHLQSDFGGALAFGAIREQIDGGRPIGLCIDWTGGGGHFVAVDGYDVNGEILDVQDSLFGPSHVALASFPSSYQGGGTWSWTYLTTPEEKA